MPQLPLIPMDEPPPDPKADLADEVFAYLRERIIATKIDFGIKPAIGPRTLGPAARKLILARIREHGVDDATGARDPALGVQACKRVIDVDEADCRRAGAISAYWDALTPFRPDNFEGRLCRWREDGNHQLFINVQGKTTAKPKDAGFFAHVPKEQHEEMLRKVSRGGSYGEDGYGGSTPRPREQAPVDNGDPMCPIRLGFVDP